MAQPFDFENTPITEQTVLVARYRGVGENAPYGGQWFRVTTKPNGKKYIPSDYQTAVSFIADSSSDTLTMSLVNQETGKLETVQAQNVTKIEFGGGWEQIPKTAMSGENGILCGSMPFTSLRSISGYPQGLSTTATLTQDGYEGAFGYLIGDTTLEHCDISGFQFDEEQFPMLFVSKRGMLSNVMLNICGVVEPLSPPPSATNLGGVQNAWFGGTELGGAAASIGFGFIGQYAQQWVNFCPSGQFTVGTSKIYRTTYLA